MEEEFITVTRYQYSAEAQIIKGRLEAEGIPVYLSDVHTIDTDPLVSNAVGGVKLKVRKSDCELALQVLDSISKYSVDDAGEDISCPNCNSNRVILMSHVRNIRSFLFFIFSFLTSALPIGIKYNYHCENCRHKFKLE